MFKFIDKLKNIYKLMLIQETNSILGRWCHVNMPKCNYDVVLKKIDMANRDNNFCIKIKNKK
jgi:hypothetical protein